MHNATNRIRTCNAITNEPASKHRTRGTPFPDQEPNAEAKGRYVVRPKMPAEETAEAEEAEEPGGNLNQNLTQKHKLKQNLKQN